MQKIVTNIFYSAVALLAFGFAAYAPTFSAKATAGATPQLYAAGDEIYGFVVGVMDGDTLKLLTVDKKELRIRLADIDAPEKGQSYGDAAKRSLSDLAFNKPASVLVTGTDRTGLVIGRVHVGTLDVSMTQVGRGMAWADARNHSDSRLSSLEGRARNAQAGLWADQRQPVAPWEFDPSNKL